MIINLGSGNKKLYGFINVDNNPKTNPDILCDGETYIKQYANNTIKHIMMDNYIEHIQDFETHLQDCIRTLKPNGKITIITIHALNFLDAYGDCNHKSRFNAMTFYIFAQRNHLIINQQITSRIPIFNPIMNLRIKQKYYLIDMLPMISTWLLPFNIKTTLIKN